MKQPVTPKAEQRLEKRALQACPIFIHGITESGARIKAHTITDNISQSGLFLQTPHALKLESHAFTFTLLQNGARLAARGEVIRTEEKEHGLSGLAVCFSQLRLIPAL